MQPHLSPDGKRLAVQILSSTGDWSIWVYDFERDTLTQLTFLKGLNADPVWTPDGNHLAFRSNAGGAQGIYWIRADGGEPQRLTDSKRTQNPTSFSPDGKRLAFVEEGRDLWTLPLEDRGTDHPRPGQPELFLQGRFVQINPQFSPDGRWIAYTSSESGRSEIYVRPFTGASPATGDKWLVWTAGGSIPYWARNGRELFYMNLDRRLMVVTYTVKGGVFVIDKPRVWSERQLAPFTDTWTFDFAPDGKRVLVFTNLRETEAQKPPTHVTFLFNFFDYLRQRVPARK